MTEHTALPWTQDIFSVYQVSDDNEWTAIASCAGKTKEERLANARFIVTACNSHADLLEALKEINKQLSVRLRHAADKDTAFIHRLQRITEPAIRKAEESE